MTLHSPFFSLFHPVIESIKVRVSKRQRYTTRGKRVGQGGLSMGERGGWNREIEREKAYKRLACVI